MMGDNKIQKVFVGTNIHCKALKVLEVFKEHVLGISSSGRILFNKEKSLLPELKKEYSISDDCIVYLSDKQFFMPGLIDTHSHAPQYLFTGTGYGLTLLDWLEKYTFPVEARFKDTEFARKSYQKVVRRSLDFGTTTNCYFATVHREGTMALVDVIEENGQRGYVGKVNMDRNSPEFYCESTKDSISDTIQFVKDVQKRPDPGNSPRVVPVVTPRFVPSCSSPLMQELGKIAEDYKLPIQSHLSENKREIAWVKELHPECKGYGDVYDTHGLFTDRSIMAHCVFLDEKEMEVMKERGVGIAHCPNSNFSLNSGVLNVRKLLNTGMKVGLGTDISGGYSPSMLDAIRQAIIASKSVFFNDESSEPLSYQEALYLATRGGATLLNMEDEIGGFEEGKQFDALLIDVGSENSPFDVYDGDDFLDYVSKFIFLGDDRNIKNIYVEGRCVKS